MKTLDIAWKDLLRAMRSATFLALGFIVPLLVSGIFYFAFGGLGSDDGGFDLPTIPVQVVNLDEAEMGFSAGQRLVEILASDDLSDLVQVTLADDAASARAAVDRQQEAVALIIPTGFTAALFAPEGQAAIELYQDPTLALGPGIVLGLVQQFVDGFAGSTIAIEVARQQLGERGITMDAAQMQQVVSGYSAWATALGESQQQGANALLTVRAPSGAKAETTNLQTAIISVIMAGMMVFFVFFTGASSTQSLLQEEEGGTLPRLFTTPTPVSSVLGGRILASLATLVLQVVVLLLLSALIFGIDWGPPLALVLVTAGMVTMAASFGLFLTSLLKDTRQGSVVFGGVLTVLGVVGMVGVFTAGVPGAGGATFETISLLTPQGWGVHGYQLLLEGGSLGDIAVPVVVMLSLSALFFVLGVFRFRKRFA